MAGQASTITKDEAIIRSNLYSFSALADQGAFEYLGRLFAPKLTVDYSALFGGAPESVARETLMKNWANFLPGFDTTFHEAGQIRLSINGDQADAAMDFTASHWLGEQGFWQVAGTYQFTLEKAADNWEITSVKLTNPTEMGSREILGQAPLKAAENLKQRHHNKVNFE